MKSFLRIITLLGVLLIIGSCSSSKSVNTNVTEIDDNKISVVIYVDRTKFSDMAQTAPDAYNSDITMYLKNVTTNSDAEIVQLEENIKLVKGNVYELSGRYDSTVNSSYVTFTPAQFTATISNDTASTLKVTMKNGYLSTVPI